MKYEQARNYTGRSLFVKCDMKQCMNEYDGEKWDWQKMPICKKWNQHREMDQIMWLEFSLL